MKSAPAELPEYRRRSFVDVMQGPPRAGANTLTAGVLEAFPLANPTRLDASLRELCGKVGAEPELLLFLTLLCGIRFSIQRPEVNSVLERLWTWLNGHPRNMPPDLADLVVEALSGDIERALMRRGGWRVGPAGPFTRKIGSPPHARGAWTATILVEHHLRNLEIAPTEAIEFAVRLTAILLGREDVEATEFYRARNSMGSPDTATLFQELSTQYEYWIVNDAIRAGTPEPKENTPKGRAAWREEHKAMPHLLNMFGSEGLALIVLQRVPWDSWEPFLIGPLEGETEPANGSNVP